MKRTLKWSAGVGVLLVLALGATIVAGLNEAASRPIARHAVLALPDWPDRAPPIRIALLSDIHLGNRAMPTARLDAIVAQVKAARPDLVLIAGDFVNGHDSTDAVAHAAALTAPLSHLHAPLGVVAVLGNHDHWTDPQAISGALGRAGITVLANRAMRRGPVAILGVDDAVSGHADLAKTVASSANIGGVPVILSHTPDIVHRLGGRIPLVLAGHTHCGQIVVPGYGPLLTHSPREHWKPLYDSRYRCGIVRDAGRTVVVTAGLGSGSSPIRLGAPPDFWLLDLGPTASNQPR